MLYLPKSLDYGFLDEWYKLLDDEIDLLPTLLDEDDSKAWYLWIGDDLFYDMEDWEEFKDFVYYTGSASEWVLTYKILEREWDQYQMARSDGRWDYGIEEENE